MESNSFSKLSLQINYPLPQPLPTRLGTAACRAGPGVELGRRLPALVVRCRCTPPHPPLSRPVGREGMQPTSYCADHIFPKLDFDAE